MYGQFISIVEFKSIKPWIKNNIALKILLFFCLFDVINVLICSVLTWTLDDQFYPWLFAFVSTSCLLIFTICEMVMLLWLRQYVILTYERVCKICINKEQM